VEGYCLRTETQREPRQSVVNVKHKKARFLPLSGDQEAADTATITVTVPNSRTYTISGYVEEIYPHISIGDINDDGYADLVIPVANKMHLLTLYDIDLTTQTGEWPMVRYNVGHTNSCYEPDGNNAESGYEPEPDCESVYEDDYIMW